MTYDLGVFKRQRYVYPTFNAVGGTISYYTYNSVAYTVHTFLSGTSTFAVFSTATVDILLVGGGASGISNGYGGQYGAGGNAGQVQTTSTALNIGQYTVIVGAGGAGNQTGSFATGSNTSIVGTINVSFASTATGATSGGGASPNGGGNGAGGSRNGNSGGVGVANNYATGLSTYYGGGGGAYDPYVSNGTGGTGGGGGAGGVSATPNTGGGGGGSGDAYISGGFYYPSGSGGSGIVVIRYPTPINSIIPINDIYFNYVSLLLSNQTTNVTTPTPITANVITKIEYIAVGGGGAGGSARLASQYELGGGGGAGGVVYGTLTNILLSSLNTIVVTVGSGGSGVGVASGNNGNNSSIVNTSIWNFTTSSIIAYGGGGGGLSSGGNNEGPAGSPGGAGGSGGGGGGASNFSGGVGAAGTSIQTSKADISLGNSGGAGQTRPASIIAAFGGSGGGAGGGGATGTLGTAAAAGAGYTWLNGTTYAAGGASGASSAAGTAYTGNGGGGASKGGSSAGTNTAGGGGGGGVVVFRYIGTNVLATGGTISTVSNYVYHTFQSSGALTAIETLSSTSTVTLSSPINYLLVGGGGGAGVVNFSNTPGGGGAGGLFTGTFTITNITNLLSITVGAGGGIRGTGGNSSITSNYVTKTAYGGGAGADGGDGGAGGSGGGAGGSNSGSGAAAAGGTNLNGPGTAAGGYGNLGGSGSSGAYGGGGGAGGAGQSFGPDGGIGLYINNPYSAYSTTYATGGAGGGGAAQTASPNTGNGGGANGGTGGSGISILWEPSSNPMPSVIGAPTIVTTGSYRVYVFTSTGGLVYGNLLSNTKFTDNSTNSYPILYNGNTSQGSFNPYAKNWSVYFNGSSYLSIPNSASYGTTRLNLDSNSNFTIEGWAYFNSVSAGMLIAHEYTIWRIGVASGTLQYSLSSNGSNYAGIASSISMGTVVVGRWYHFALVRNGSTFTPYLNGIAGTPTISSASLYAGTNEGLTIGMGDTNNYFSGYLSNIRILKGTAFYTAPFTPAISPLPLVSNTLLLTCSNSTWDDVSDYNWSIIPKGIPAVKKFSPFSNFGSYNPTLVGGSAYFNGTTDYLTISTTSTTNVPNWTYLHDGTTDYTIEGWIYPLSTATQQGLIGTSDISNTAVSGMALYLTSGGVLSWAIMNGSASFPSGTVSNSVKPNAWNHVACTFASSSKITNIYINGFKLSTTATTTSSFTATSASYPLTIGRSAVSTLNTYSGYISNLRILKGVISDGVVTNNIGIGKTLEYLVVAGGGGAPAGGGGGGGGFRTGTFVTTQTGIIYTVTVGNGGAAGVAGGNSSLVGGSLNFVSAGGGYGSISGAGGAGGSGGGSGAAGGTGNTPATVPAQGYNGGTGSGGSAGYGGGGGATSAGFERGGGDGALSNIDGLGYYYSGGGGGLGGGYTGGSGGIGGGGYGTGYNWGNGGGGSRGTASSTSGFSNSGGGGGTNGAGGSGIVIIRYLGPQRATGGNIITTNISGYTVHTFLSSGVFTDNMPSYTLPVAPVAASSTATNLLLNFTDSVIVDASSNTDIYTGGDSGLASLVKKYNNMSMYFDGTTGTGLTISTSSAVALGFSDFTVEMWMYPLASYNSGNAPALLDARTTGDGAGLIRFGFNGTTIYGGPQIAWRENVTSIVTATVILNVWQHIAVVRNSGVITMYNNGTAISSTSNSTDLIVPFKYIAQTYNNLSFSGYIDDLRITNGIARYTTAFIPPIQKLQLK